MRLLLDRGYVPAIILPAGRPDPHTFAAIQRGVDCEESSSRLSYVRDWWPDCATYYDDGPTAMEKIEGGRAILLTAGEELPPEQQNTERAAVLRGPKDSKGGKGGKGRGGKRRALQKDLAGVLLAKVLRAFSEDASLRRFCLLSRPIAGYLQQLVATAAPHRGLAALDAAVDFERWRGVKGKGERGKAKGKKGGKEGLSVDVGRGAAKGCASSDASGDSAPVETKQEVLSRLVRLVVGSSTRHVETCAACHTCFLFSLWPLPLPLPQVQAVHGIVLSYISGCFGDHSVSASLHSGSVADPALLSAETRAASKHGLLSMYLREQRTFFELSTFLFRCSRVERPAAAAGDAERGAGVEQVGQLAKLCPSTIMMPATAARLLKTMQDIVRGQVHRLAPPHSPLLPA